MKSESKKSPTTITAVGLLLFRIILLGVKSRLDILVLHQVKTFLSE